MMVALPSLLSVYPQKYNDCQDSLAARPISSASLEASLEHLVNTRGTLEQNGQVTFLHIKIEPGVVDKIVRIHVAKIAGLQPDFKKGRISS